MPTIGEEIIRLMKEIEKDENEIRRLEASAKRFSGTVFESDYYKQADRIVQSVERKTKLLSMLTGRGK